MDLHGEGERQQVFGDLINSCSDTPASCKFAGLAGHSSADHPCRWCQITLAQVSSLAGYEPQCKSLCWEEWAPRFTKCEALAFSRKDDAALLQASFQSRSAGKTRQAVILKTSGARFSIMNTVAGWLPSTKSALDFMHCIFLGGCYAF